MHQCMDLMSASDQSSSTTGTIVCLPDSNPKALDSRYFTAMAEADNDSGTTPTLDITVQTCRTTSTSTCHDTPAVFDQCTTGNCWTDGTQNIDLDADTVNVLPCFRVVTTLAGTSPVYDVVVRLCWK